MMVDGMGHHLLRARWPTITSRIANLIHQIEADAGSDTTAALSERSP